MAGEAGRCSRLVGEASLPEKEADLQREAGMREEENATFPCPAVDTLNQ